MIVKNYKGFNIANEGILSAVIVQFNKDLLLAGFSTSFDLNSSLVCFETNFLAWINVAYDEQRAKFNRLLYRVDVNEGKIFNSSIDKIGQLIIEREFQKVVLRKYFNP